jgi:hypothetical protein
MATIVTRAGKGSPLTHTEVDANFTNLNDEAATKAPLASPALTGTPTAPTATVGTNTTQIATTAFVIANAGSLNSPAFTGTPTAPTASVGTNTTQLATTAFVNAEIANDAPTKTGGGASGTWSIAISGNAATATSLSTDRTNWSSNGTIDDVVGQLAWKNYGNNHTIFDASNSTSPNGGGVNNTNAQIAWTGTYPTLMGWNGANTYGVRVDSARVADSVGSVSTAQVLAAEAGASAGAVGTYAYCTRAGNSSTYTIGSTIGGGDLRYSNANGLNSGTPGGTWRCMGYAAGTPNSVNTTTLWLRIS